MPGNILNADTGFPQFTGDESSDAKIDKVMNYLYMLLEQLRYSLNNLDADNFNDTGLREIGEGIARPLQTSFENEFSKTNALIEGISDEFGSQIRLLTDWVGTDADGNLISSAANITQSVNTNAASITSLTQFRKTVEDGTISSISSINQKADANAASIVQLNQWKGTTSSSLAAVQTLASQNEAEITSLTSWRNAAEDDIDGLAASVAAIDQVADENGASITQIVNAVGEDGEVNAASIVAAVNAAGSSVKIDADHLDVDAFVTFSSLETDGETTVNGNNISLILDGDGDDGETDIESESALNFIYKHYRSSEWQEKEFAKLYTSIDGADTDETSRYSLNISANRFENDLGETSYASLKLEAAGRVSIKGQYGMYLGTYGTYGYIKMEASDNTRIAAKKTFSKASGSISVTSTDYSFNTDGIYYGSKQILNTSGGVTAVFG